MNETITITVQTAGIIFLIGILGGVFSGLLMVRAYVKSRGIKTKAQKELMRLAKFISKHHPEAVREDALVDIAIDLIKHPTVKEKWRME